MRKTILTLAILGTIGVLHAAEVIKGSASQGGSRYVGVGASNSWWGQNGEVGASFGNTSSRIALQPGIDRVKQAYNYTPINAAEDEDVDGTEYPQYVHPQRRNPSPRQAKGQAWYENRAFDTEVFSIRKLQPAIMNHGAKFGGIVAAKVSTLATNLYFGEWSPEIPLSKRQTNGTDLNFNAPKHTAWFVGDKPTTSIDGLTVANYNILGINQHVPGQNDFYTGSVTADFTNGRFSDGYIERNGDVINFQDVSINNDGTFARPNNQIGEQQPALTGRFYGNGAAALAGHTINPDHRKDVAFGGAKTFGGAPALAPEPPAPVNDNNNDNNNDTD